MIKIKTDFDRTVFKNVVHDNPTPLYTYYDSMFTVFISKYKDNLLNQNVAITNDDFEFQFLPDTLKNSQTDEPYTISFKVLVTGTREEVMAVDGIKLYMDICCLNYCCRYITESIYSFFKKLYCIFPKDIIYKGNCENKREYTININGVKKTITTKFVKKHTVTNKKAIVEYIKDRFSECINLNGVNDLKQIKSEVNKLFSDTCSLLDTNIIKENNNLKFINYEDMDGKLRHQLIDSLGIKTCPYCNRQYITSYVKEDNNNTTADLDHYYQKSLFPLFALSSFNFIPSCHVCNSLMKGDKYVETLYPYEDSAEEDIRFDIVLKNGQKKKNIVDIWLGKGKNSFPEIEKISELNVINLIKAKDDAKKTKGDRYREKLIDNEIELFHLKEIYKNHLDQAVNVLLIMRIYLEEYFYTRNINSICKNIGITSVKNGTSITKEEIRSFLLGLVIDGQGEMDKPLAKMISDIYNNEVKNVSSNSKIEVNSIEEKILKLNIQDAIDLLRNSPLSEKDIIDLIAKKFEVAVEVVKKNYDEYYGD